MGIFDVSHMGEFEVTGPDRNAFVNRITCNDVGALEPGGVQYSGILTREGTFVDDCTVYRFDDKLMIVVNASNVAAAWEHIVDQKGGANVRLKDISADVGLIAIQGPEAEKTLQPLADLPLSSIGYYRHDSGKIAGCQCFISRTGYTGEDGFELYCRWRDTPTIWEALLAAGAAPIGLGARDSLRLEMGYALYGHEIDRNITPLEAGLGWIVKLDKGAPFTGKDALGAQKARGVTRKLVGFKLLGRGIARQGYPVWHRRQAGRPGAERHAEPVARRGHRHHVPSRRGGEGRHPVRDRVPGRAHPRGSGGAAVLEERIGEEGGVRKSARGQGSRAAG